MNKKLTTILLFMAIILASGCAQYDTAVETLEWLEPDTFNCDVVQIKSADSFLCKYPDLQINSIKLAGIKIIPSKKSQAKDFLKSVLKRDTLVNIEPDKEAKEKGYGALSYVWVPGGKMLNLVLVERGYAEVDPDKVNDRHEAIFIQTQKIVESNKKVEETEVIEEVEIEKEPWRK